MNHVVPEIYSMVESYLGDASLYSYHIKNRTMADLGAKVLFRTVTSLASSDGVVRLHKLSENAQNSSNI